MHQLTLLIILCGISTASAQNLLTNGSFEDPVFSDPSINHLPSVPGWSGIPFIFAGNNGSVWPDGAASGGQFADIGNDSGTYLVEQTFTVPANTLSSVSWSATTSASRTSLTYRVELLASPGGAVLESQVFTALGGTSNDTWDSESLVLSNGPHGVGDYTLTFETINSGGLDAFIDDVVALAPVESTISPTAKLAWTANAGWVNFRPSAVDGAITSEGFLSHFAYAANLGWINLGDGSPANGYRYSNTDGSDAGVNLDANGDLDGLAWSANAGWINFGWDVSGTVRRPRIDLLTGEFKGFAYGANIGWVKLDGGGLTTEALLCEDTDGDGLPDAWEMQQFGNLNKKSIGDSDGDGASELDEYLALSNPNDATDIPAEPTIEIFTISPTKPDVRLLRIDAHPGRIYQLSVSEDLETWTPSGPAQTPRSARELEFVGDEVTDPAVRKFFRIDYFKPLQQ